MITHKAAIHSLILALVVGVIVSMAFLSRPARAEEAPDTLAGQLRELDDRVFTPEEAKEKQLGQMLSRHARARRDEANRRETKAWRAIRDRADWERYRDDRLQALRDSLGTFPPVPRDLKVRVTRKLEGDGYRIENVVFESRPGLVVTANLYVPAEPPKSMPGILICHSHHNPKTEGELQDMGMTWARLGCLVLVMDQLGHGERRQHPFRDASSYEKPFRVGRQDYYFRYNTGMQLHLIGDSLIGWMVWDLMRGVDLLLSRPGIDKERILLLGSVAGGGDPAAVTAALDPRITAVAPFNFGGPQPETTFPLPEDPENAFNYAGGGSWESTRNLRLSARDGFLPWVIVGAAAPRRLIFAHEFSWDREHDPVWARLEKIYGFYDVRDRLASVHGRGQVTGKPPESTHCNNIGPEHRQQIYPTLKRWFGLPEPDKEFSKRRTVAELTCLPQPPLSPDRPEGEAKGKAPHPLYELAGELGKERAAAARKRLADLAPEARRQNLCQEWAKLLGEIEPVKGKVTHLPLREVGTITVDPFWLPVEADIVVPALLLLPPRKPNVRLPVVVAVAQEGKKGFLRKRSEVLAELLNNGVAVCLPDLRGTGETAPAGDSRGRQSASTSISSTELMLGQTLVGARLRDLRSVLHHLRGREELDPSHIALWGDSFASSNPLTVNLWVPLDAENLPNQSEPLGGLLALLGALYEKDVCAVYARAGLTGYQSILESPFCYVPHDVIVPGVLKAGDLCDVAAALAPRPLRLTELVDGRNCHAEELVQTYEPARTAYRAASAQDRLQLVEKRERDESAARWLLEEIKRE
jgi:hypothetical protein